MTRFKSSIKLIERTDVFIFNYSDDDRCWCMYDICVWLIIKNHVIHSSKYLSIHDFIHQIITSNLLMYVEFNPNICLSYQHTSIIHCLVVPLQIWIYPLAPRKASFSPFGEIVMCSRLFTSLPGGPEIIKLLRESVYIKTLFSEKYIHDTKFNMIYCNCYYDVYADEIEIRWNNKRCIYEING